MMIVDRVRDFARSLLHDGEPGPGSHGRLLMEF